MNRLNFNRTNPHANTDLIMVQQDFTDPNCPPLCVWMGCGNVQVNPKKHTSPSDYTKFDGSNTDRSAWTISVPSTPITRYYLNKGDIHVIVKSTCSIDYNHRFIMRSEPVENTVNGSWVHFQAVRDYCNCESYINGCDYNPSCPNGISVEFDGVGSLEDFVNCQSLGTTICLPSGSYAGFDVTIDYVVIKPCDGATVSISPPFNMLGINQQDLTS